MYKYVGARVYIKFKSTLEYSSVIHLNTIKYVKSISKKSNKVKPYYLLTFIL